METIVKINFEFKMQNAIWRVTSKGIENWWGVTSLRTQAFISMSTEEILEQFNLKKEE
jgi:hypothetical protein